jgi:hypothetical protein
MILSVHCGHPSLSDNAGPSSEEQAFVRKNPDHHAYHYADIPIQQPKYIAGTAGTARDDVVQVIDRGGSLSRWRFQGNGVAGGAPVVSISCIACRSSHGALLARYDSDLACRSKTSKAQCPKSPASGRW